jgi:DNA-binding transcriptional MerR regulator
MNIKDTKNKYNISVRTIRYYEEIGIIKSTRNSSNIRDFDGKELKKLELILILRELNIKLKDIKEIVCSNSNISLADTLKDEISRLDADIRKLKNKRRLISSLLDTYGSSDITKHNIKEFMKHQLYVSSANERLSKMLIKRDNIVLEIGEGLVPTATKEELSLLDAVKVLRTKMNKGDNIFIDKIRIKDNMDDLRLLEYRILYGDKVIIKQNVHSKEINGQINEIVSCLEKTINSI